MENATKALEMAAGVLLGVIILAVIVYFFGSISLWPQEQDDIQTAEQLSDFNLEYEVYDKKAMDVVSLNMGHTRRDIISFNYIRY